MKITLIITQAICILAIWNMADLPTIKQRLAMACALIVFGLANYVEGSLRK